MTHALNTRRACLATTALVVAMLAGCAAMKTVSSDISTYGEWPTGRQPGTYTFDRLPSQQAQPERTARLELAARPALEKAGFRQTEAGQTPDVLVQVAARTSRAESGLWADPMWWHGGWGPYRRPWSRPLWGPDLHYTSQRFDREVALLIRDNASGKPLYEARATNEGGTAGASDALNTALFQAALFDFPRNGPNPRSVDVQLP